MKIQSGPGASAPEETVAAGMYRLLPTLMSISHILACVWWYIGDKIDVGLGSKWIDYFEGFGTRDIRAHGSIPEQYMLSIYWITTSLSTSGLIGDMQPKNWAEMLFTCVVMGVQLTFFKYVLGEISNLVMEQDAELVKTRQTVMQMKNFIEVRELPEELSSEISAFMSTDNSKKHVEGEADEDIFDLLSHSLQVDVARHSTRALLENLTMFKTCSTNFLDGISVMLRENTILPEVHIFRVNEVTREMYIIISGCVELTTTPPGEDVEVVDSIVQEGQVFGEVGFLFGMRQTTNARTTSGINTVLLTLQKADFTQLTKLYPEEEEMITKAVLNQWEESYTGKSSAGGGGGTSDAASSTGSDNISIESKTTATVDPGELSSVKKVLANAKAKKLQEKTVAMVEAASKNEIVEVERILSAGDVTVNEGDYDRRTALHLAASEGHMKMVMMLVSKFEADVNVKDNFGGTPAADALRHKRIDVLNYLVSKNAKLDLADPAAEICQAAADGDLDQLRRLVHTGLDVNCCDYDSRTALHLAASNGHLPCVQYLLELKAIDVNPEDRKGGTPLEDAVRHDHKEVQKLLGDKGGTFGSNTDVAAQLCEAAAKNDLDSLKTMYNSNVNLNITDYDNRSAIHLAASNGCEPEPIIIGSCAGAPVMGAGPPVYHTGCTADSPNVEVMSWLLQQKGIDVNPVDRYGFTPLEDAYRHDHKVMILMLEMEGGVRAGHPSLSDKILEMLKGRDNVKVKQQKQRVEESALKSPEIQLIQKCGTWKKVLNDLVSPLFEQLTLMLTMMGQLMDMHMVKKQNWGQLEETKRSRVLELGNELTTIWRDLCGQSHKSSHKAAREKGKAFFIGELLKNKLVALHCPKLQELNKATTELMSDMFHAIRQ
eukprot:gene4787-5854_t